ncbi:MAG: hydrogenase small subunit [Negativicutes bacterium]|nr:hydrogenase small subunit [Negativicutes bacterium]
MDFGLTLWESFQKRKLSRRSFIKTCTALAGIMGLPPTVVPDIIARAETRQLVPVIWMHGLECTGCSESFIRSKAPLASDVVLTMISLEYDDTLSAASGIDLEHHREKIMKDYAGKFILIAEGGVPTGYEGFGCTVGGVPYIEALKETAKTAAVVMEFGSCASWGGIQAAKPNPTQVVAVSQVITDKPIVKVPGCPPIPEVMTGVVMHYALFGQLPPLDQQGRPKQFFGNRIHDTCYRRPFFDSGMFVERLDDAGSKAGWCLYKMGCRGPMTYNSCGNMRWWQGLSYPIQAGSPCIGCSSAGFWDNDPFFERLPHVVTANTISSADQVGLAAAGVTLAGIAVHAGANVLRGSRAASQDSPKDGDGTDITSGGGR